MIGGQREDRADARGGYAGAGIGTRQRSAMPAVQAAGACDPEIVVGDFADIVDLPWRQCVQWRRRCDPAVIVKRDSAASADPQASPVVVVELIRGRVRQRLARQQYVRVPTVESFNVGIG